MRMMAGWEPLPFASIASPAPHVPPAPLPQSAKVSILCFLGDLRQAKPYTDPKTKMKGYQASVMTAEVIEAFNAYQQEYEEHINIQVRTGAFYPFSKIIADIFEKREPKSEEKQVADVRVQHAALAVTSSLPGIHFGFCGILFGFSGFASLLPPSALNPSVQKTSLNQAARNGGKVGATTLQSRKPRRRNCWKGEVGGSIPGKIVDMLKISKEDAIRMIADSHHPPQRLPPLNCRISCSPPQSAADLKPKCLLLRGVWFPSNPYYRGYITFRATSSNAQTIQALSAYKQEASETPANAKIGVFYPFSKIAADIIEKYYVMQPHKANEQRRLQSLSIAQISTLADFILEFGANPSGGEDEPIYDIARVAPLLGHLFRAVSTTDANGSRFGDRFIDYKAKALDSLGERRTKPFPAGGIFYSFKQLARRVRMKFYYFKDLADIEELERRSTDNVETRKVATGVTAETIGKPKPNVKTGMSASVVNGKNIETRKVVAGVKVGTIGKAKPNVKIGMSANAVNALKSHIAALPTQVNKLGSVNVSQPGSNSAPAQPQLRPIAPANVQYTQTTLLGPQLHRLPFNVL
ncbi:hypothetical protein BC829DRAFT_379791 [Chytridium lagenaria]|nr:hypothetical protein BC829DRAFT_379791 [Chytridium lagenaria]